MGWPSARREIEQAALGRRPLIGSPGAVSHARAATLPHTDDSGGCRHPHSTIQVLTRRQRTGVTRTISPRPPRSTRTRMPSLPFAEKVSAPTVFCFGMRGASTSRSSQSPTLRPCDMRSGHPRDGSRSESSSSASSSPSPSGSSSQGASSTAASSSVSSKASSAAISSHCRRARSAS
jgi:hypothetical protein